MESIKNRPTNSTTRGVTSKRGWRAIMSRINPILAARSSPKTMMGTEVKELDLPISTDQVQTTEQPKRNRLRKTTR